MEQPEYSHCVMTRAVTSMLSLCENQTEINLKFDVGENFLFL